MVRPGPSDPSKGKRVGSKSTRWDVPFPCSMGATYPIDGTSSHQGDIHVAPSNPPSVSELQPSSHTVY